MNLNGYVYIKDILIGLSGKFDMVIFYFCVCVFFLLNKKNI